MYKEYILKELIHHLDAERVLFAPKDLIVYAYDAISPAIDELPKANPSPNHWGRFCVGSLLLPVKRPTLQTGLRSQSQTKRDDPNAQRTLPLPRVSARTNEHGRRNHGSLRSSINTKYEQAVLDEMKGLGGYIISLGETDTNLNFSSGFPEEVRNVFYLPAL